MPSSTISRKGTAPSCRRFHFAFDNGKRRPVMLTRHQAVAEYVESWLDATIVAERTCGTECRVTVEIGRPVPVPAAERFCRECPHYIRDTFAAIAATPPP